MEPAILSASDKRWRLADQMLMACRLASWLYLAASSLRFGRGEEDARTHSQKASRLMHDSRTVANALLDLANENGDTLTPMQLLKLVYIAHGWMLGLYGVPLIEDDVEAWRYGPVIPKLYKAISQFRDQPVRGPLPHDPTDDLVDVESGLIKQIYEIYGMRTGIDLSRLTHQPGSPWAQSYAGDGSNVVISNDIIEEHYRMLSERAEQA